MFNLCSHCCTAMTNPSRRVIDNCQTLEYITKIETCMSCCYSRIENEISSEM